MLEEEVVDHARAVLDDLLGWEMTGQGWREVAELVADLTEAVRSGASDAVHDATEDLAVVAPVRATRIGEEPVVPPPPFVLERRSETLDSLRANENVEGDDERPDAG
ncbi:hypothetical protein B0I31_11564 [Saccharothrix carnea]|uniref:CATRA-Associated Small Protein domain-containing protein n=1 Tax=Saccharothrix carnea TaxID=1280637 RepID=A0A2P8I0Z4_SACCR|nr:CATRA system-associated protein [Saccharothrix carnea]PSL52112.1 hypothetical protein B0I31_11564 [Saccharothrix carnea]